MKFTLGWLKDHLETDADLETILFNLTDLGLEVEEVIDPAKQMAGFRVAEVLEANPHPDADKLRVCKVRGMVDGEEQIVQVVCGAPNARAGMKAVFAPVGSYLPAIDLTLTKAKIRGVESFGMLVSERELGFSDEHDGIIDLPADTEFGTGVAQAYGLDDPMIEIAITPNRPDCLGVRGIARDLAARGLGTLKADPVAAVTASHDTQVAIEVDGTDCPVFAGRLVKGVKNGESPAWLQARLKAIGLRPISALVDITNYISYDRGRPLHVYDASKVSGTITARPAKEGEKFTALDDNEYTTQGGECVIADANGVLGFGGIMGGLESGCSNATTDVIIESAWFDPIRTATTGRIHMIDSDARYRFERGVDPETVLTGIEQATQMVLDLCGGEAGPVCVGGEVPDHSRSITLALARVQELTGLVLSGNRIAEILTALGFSSKPEGDDALKVAVPSWRPDIEGAADLVEEVARVHGLDKLPAETLPTRTDGMVKVTTLRQDRLRWARRALAARGLNEAVTWSFMDSKHMDLFGGANTSVTLVNPISSELDTMRPSIVPNLALAAGRNAARGLGDIGLFEVGPQFAGDQKDDQQFVATALRRGQTGPRDWLGESRPVDWLDAKADVLAVLEELGTNPANVQIVADAPGWYHPGRSGSIRLGPKIVLAHFGELHPKVLTGLDVSGPMVAAEIFVENLPEPKARKNRSKGALHVSSLQAVTRDFAFVVDQAVESAKLVQAALKADKKLIDNAYVFDVYQGKGLEEGQKSLALTVHLQPTDKTLTDEQIDKVADAVIASVEKATGGKLRG